MNKIKLKKTDIRDVLKVSFPGYRGRKFHLRIASTAHLEGNWDGGSRTETVAVGIKEGVWAGMPMPKSHGTDLTIPDNIILVNHIWFCGSDLGIEILASPNCVFLPKVLPAQA